jgi:glycosyltransferase involved in cell wall biosynthesis
MKISVVISTLGRRKELDDLLFSMYEINKYSHEVLIIDQNFNELLDHTILKHAKNINIIHHKVDFRSLSKAKNFGTMNAKGELICYPDDDSTFLEKTIYNAITFLEENQKIDGVFGKCVDNEGVDSVIKFGEISGELSLDDFEGKFVEATLFGRTKILKNNLFDENLGIGAFFGAEEGYDLVYRLLKLEIKLLYYIDILFYHPQTILDYGSFGACKRVFNYRMGFSYLCMKHFFYYKYIKRLLSVFIAIFLHIFFNIKKSKYYLIEFSSLIVGGIIAKIQLK